MQGEVKCPNCGKRELNRSLKKPCSNPICKSREFWFFGYSRPEEIIQFKTIITFIVIALIAALIVGLVFLYTHEMKLII